MSDLARLLRVRLGLLAAAGSLAGHLLHPGGSGWSLAGTALAAFLLAGGSSALNQVQERQRDALMSRTRQRPLPAGRLGVGPVLTLALAALGIALGLLWLLAGAAPVWLGLAVVVLYNCLYTPLKGRTPFALLVGAVAGAMPPLLGWLTAGGVGLDFRVLLMAAVFYLWQVPHFSLLARRHPGDYQAAGLPLDSLAWTGRGRSPLMVWLAGYGALVALAPLCGLVGSPLAKALLGALALALVLAGAWSTRRPWLSLGLVNASLLLFLVCVIADAAWWEASPLHAWLARG